MPDFTHLLEASFTIQLHVYSAFIALFLGGFILWKKKGGILHKNLGRIWVASMVVVAVSSFWIHSFRLVGPFSPIHLLSLWALWSLFDAIRHIRSGRIQAHKKAMRTLYLYALVGAGFFTFLPGRLMHNIFFGAS